MGEREIDPIVLWRIQENRALVRRNPIPHMTRAYQAQEAMAGKSRDEVCSGLTDEQAKCLRLFARHAHYGTLPITEVADLMRMGDGNAYDLCEGLAYAGLLGRWGPTWYCVNPHIEEAIGVKRARANAAFGP